MKAFFFVLALGVAQAQSYTFIEFDAPGATSTTVTSINNSGQILGMYETPSGRRCFLRAPDGTFTSFDPPGTGGLCVGLNNLGSVVGGFYDAKGGHGYVRNAAGDVTIFDLTVNPGASANAINDRGEIVGTLGAPPNGGPAFFRSAEGQISSFQAPSLGDIEPMAINNNGEIAGWVLVGGSTGPQHGFLRSAAGAFRQVDLPGTTTYTRIAALNNQGQFAGTMIGGPGFVSNADGTFTLLPGYTVSGLNDAGQIAGYHFDGKTFHGFIGTQATGPTAPEIRTELPGVLPAPAFRGVGSIAPGTWIEIYGRNLAPTTRSWRLDDFTAGRAPTSLDGVSVSIGGIPAYVSSISPGQVNALVPSNVPIGMAQVTVSNGAAVTAPATIAVSESRPAMLALSPSSPYLLALYPDFTTYALPETSLFEDLPVRRAKAGDTLVFFGAGFGPVSPDTPLGRVAPAGTTLTARVEFSFSRIGPPVAGNVLYAGLAPGTVGLYQFNVVLPDIPLLSAESFDDFVSVNVTIDGRPVSPSLLLSVAK